MCGFVAITLPSGHPLDDAVQSTVAAATDLIRHRGPDDHGQLAVHGAAFGFRRLAILDRSLAGHQPMQTEDGRFTMVFNGEIYNYVELRRELTARGHIFRSSGDTEVLLRGFAEWGNGVFDRAAGMFAVCIHDAAHHTMTAVRDRFGIKPLFMCHTPRGWAFASEIKALRPLASSAWAANVPRWAMFLRDGRTEGLPESEETFVTGVDQVLPGTIVTVHADGSRRERIFWSPDQIEPDDTTTVDMVRNGLEQAVREHLRSDVPVGVLLSGGVDSSALACLGVHLTGGRGASAIRHAFSYQSAAFEEGAQIDAVVAATGLSLHRIGDERAPDLFQTLRKVLWHHDEPFHGPNVLVSYDLYRMARAQGVPVVLNGQGSDEAFGGYYGGFGV